MEIGQISEILTVIGIIIAIFTLAWRMQAGKKTLDVNNKTRSAQIAQEFNKTLLEDKFRMISRIMTLSKINKKSIRIGIEFKTDINQLQIHEFELDNYLSELETLSLFINDKVINIKYAYKLFGDQINNVFTNNEVSKIHR